MPLASATPSASVELQEKLAFVLPRLWLYTDTWVERVRSEPTFYPRWLALQHPIVRAACPLMEAARDESRRRSPGDRVATELVSYFEMLIEEERGHDAWLLDDLEALGWDPAVASAQVPSAATAALVGAQYYWIFHFHPVALLGYIEIMEGYPPQPGLIDSLVEASGFPRAAFRTLERHGTLDLTHREYLHDALDRLDPEPEHRRAIGLSALATVNSLIAVNDEFLRG